MNTDKFEIREHNAFVAYIDILGFSDMRDVMEAKLERYMEIIHEASNYSKLKYALFSDNAMLYSSDFLSDDNFLRLFNEIVQACSMILYNCIVNDIPIRGCISVGRINVLRIGDNIIITGKPIIDAVSNEKNQEWIGIMISPLILRGGMGHYKELRKVFFNSYTSDFIYSRFIDKIKIGDVTFFNTIEYEIPTKMGKGYLGVAVIPFNLNTMPIDLMFLEKNSNIRDMKDHLRYLQLNSQIIENQSKYSNTMNFLQHCDMEIWGLWEQTRFIEAKEGDDAVLLSKVKNIGVTSYEHWQKSF